jgi:hypothetical protein
VPQSGGALAPKYVRAAARGRRSILVVSAVLVVVAVVFIVSGPAVRWIGKTAGLNELPYRETASFINPAIVNAGIKGGTHVGVALTANRGSVLSWSETISGLPVAFGVVVVRPGVVSDVQVPLPVVSKRTWATILVEGLPAALRVEVKR